MKTLIAYSSKYGSTQRCAEILEKKLSGDVTVADIGKNKKVDVEEFDRVIIGGPIYMGKLNGDTRKFCLKNLKKLKTKKIGLFKCGMDKDTPAEQIISAQYPPDLVEIAVAKKGFGGACVISRMSGFDKMIFTKVAKTTEDSDNIDLNSIDEFVSLMEA